MAISEAFSVVSSTAVVITLIFLFFQMRQTNKNQQALLQQGRSARISDAIVQRANPLLAETWGRAQKGEALDSIQVQALGAWLTACFYNFEDSFLQHRNGLLPRDARESEVAWMSAFLTMPFVRTGWTMTRGTMAAEFRSYVDGLLAGIEPRKPFDFLEYWNEFMKQELAKAV
jgi:hypothetical protein